jgi:hypothetical protein
VVSIKKGGEKLGIVGRRVGRWGMRWGFEDVPGAIVYA